MVRVFSVGMTGRVRGCNAAYVDCPKALAMRFAADGITCRIAALQGLGCLAGRGERPVCVFAVMSPARVRAILVSIGPNSS